MPESESRRALFSVCDKAGAAELASGLIRLGWEILASRGTAAALAAEGLAVTDVSDHTGHPPLLGHRVVTLHPRVHGGILADSGDPGHVAELDDHQIALIDLVVVNLYPFETSPRVENIDIGGPALLRAAAKNHARVGVVADPADYPAVLSELSEHGQLSDETRLRLARTAFARTRDYDRAVTEWMNSLAAESADSEAALAETGAEEDTGLPETLRIRLERAEVLRYGENPHQRAARYRHRGRHGFFDRVIRRGGRPASYLNLADAAAAWGLVGELGARRPAAVIVKHANPCGAAAADSLAESYALALECDAQSAFGGVVALGSAIDDDTAEALIAGPKADVVIAPGYAPGVCGRLKARRASTLLLEAPAGSPPGGDGSAPSREHGGHPAADGTPTPADSGGSGDRRESVLHPRWHLRQLGGEFLLQDAESRGEVDGSAWQVVTDRHPTPGELADAVFAWQVCAATASNAVVLARDAVAWGIGAGQQNRAEAGRLAVARAAGRAEGGACASDGFYPFVDGVEAAAAAGAAVVVQPGGSINDDEVIAAAAACGMAMLFTGRRRFRH